MDGAHAEVTTEPRVGAAPPSLAESSLPDTVIMSRDDLPTSTHVREDPQTEAAASRSRPAETVVSDIHVEDGAFSPARSWHGEASELHPADAALLDEAAGSSRGRKSWLIIGLIAVIGLSLYSVTSLPDPDDDSEVKLQGANPNKEDPPPGTEEPPAPPVPPPPPVLDQGSSVSRFLKAPVEWVKYDEGGAKEKEEEPSVEYSKVIGHAIPRGKITVVNFWATWCEPCKKEMPGLKRMFEVSGWGDEVRFVPIQSDEKPPVWGFQMFSELMPAHQHFLVGVDPLAALVDDKVLDPNPTLPITLLLDCKRRLRYHHIGELRNVDVAELERLVDELRGELTKRYCKPPPPPPPPPPPRPPKSRPKCGAVVCAATDECTIKNGEPKCVGKLRE